MVLCAEGHRYELKSAKPSSKWYSATSGRDGNGWSRNARWVSELVRDGHHGLVPAAQRFLVEMEQYQAEILHEFEKLLREHHFDSRHDQ